MGAVARWRARVPQRVQCCSAPASPCQTGMQAVLPGGTFQETKP